MKSGTASKPLKIKKNRRFLLQALGFACLSAALSSTRAQNAYTWDGGTGNWSNNSMWNVMMSPNDPSADVYVDGGKTGVNSVVNVDGGYTVGRLTVDAGDTVNINDNQTLTVQTGSFTGSGSVIDNGTINVASGGNDGTALHFTNGAASLSGTGTLNMLNAAFVYADSGNLLTVGAGFTVAGQGQLGNGSTSFSNSGTINANINGGTLDLRPGGGTSTFTNAATGATRGGTNATAANHGLVEATNGGTLDLDGNNGGVFSNGTFQALTGSTVNIVNSPTISNATLTTAGSGVINFFSGTLSNVTSTGTINVPDNNTGTLAGTFTNSSTLTINSAGNDGTGLALSGNVTLAGTGTINMLNSAFLYNNGAGGGNLLTVGAGVTITGQGQLGNGSTSFANSGLINANINGTTLDLRPGGTPATFVNQGAGLVEASNGGTLNLDGNNGGTFSGGTFQALAGSTVNVVNGTTVSSATLTTAGSGVINLFGSSTLSNVASTGIINVPDNQMGQLAGTFTNNGTLTINSAGNDGTTLALSGPVVLAGTGTIAMTNNAFLYGNGGSLLTVGAGVTIQGQGQLGAGVTTFVNNGLVNANVGGGTLDLRPGGGAATFTNSTTGVAEASGGGTLNLDGNNAGTFIGGTFKALAGSTVNILDGTTVSSAALTNTGSGFFQLYGNSTLSNVTSTATINVPDNSQGQLAGTFTNNGTLNIASGGNDGTNLFLPGNVTLAGTGTINLTNNAFLYGNNTQLTIGAGQVIQGNGQIGNGSTTFLNSGLINANVSGGSIDLRPSGNGGAATFTNQGAGLAEASNGGTLYLDGNNGGVFGGGSFQALSNSTVNILNGATVSGATLSGAGVFQLYGSSTLSNVTSTGTINVPDNTQGQLAGTFTNNGTLTVASGGNDGTNLFLSNNVTLAGTGTISMTNNAFLYGNGGTLLTIGAGQVIQGQGNLGNGSTTFVNNGLINANVNGQGLDLRPGGGTATFVNQGAGLAEASNGGTLDLDGYNGGNFSGGTFQALTGSTVNILNSTTVSGALLSTTGTGVIQLYNSAVLSNVTSTGTINVPDNNIGYLANTFTNNGTLTVASGGNDGTTLFLSNNVTLAGTGTINLTNTAFLYGSGGTSLTVGANATVAGTGQLGNGGTTFVNNGTINGNASGGNLDVRPSNGNGTADFVNTATGLTEASGGGTTHLDGNNGGLFTNNGTFEAVSGSTGGNSTLTVDAGTLTNYAGTTLTGGTYKVIATSTAATSTLSLGGGSITTNAANVVLSGANTVFSEIAPLATNSGSFTVANGRNFTTAGALANSGAVVAAGGSTLTVSGAFNQSAAGTLTGNGAFTATSFTISGAVNPGGTVNPATGAYTSGAGTTTLNGDTTFNVATQFHFELGAMTGTNDHLNINGVLNLNGTLNVTALAGFGTGTYDLIDYPVASNPLFTLNHGTLALGTLPSGYTYVVNYAIPGQVDLTVVQNAIPEPGAWTFVLGGGALLLGAQRFRRRGN